MKREYTYIAFLLAGIFSFTISSQAIHVLWHTSLIHTECHHGDHNHGHAHSHNPSDDSDKNSLKFDSPHEDCFICEFEISIAEKPGIFIPESLIPQNDLHFITRDNTLHSHFTLHQKSPRAPPSENS